MILDPDDEAMKAREHCPEPSRIKAMRYIVAIPPKMEFRYFPFREQFVDEPIKRITFTKELITDFDTGTTFYAWCINKKIYF